MGQSFVPADNAALPIRVEKEDVLRIRGVALCRLHALHPSIRHKMRGRHRNLSDLNHLLGPQRPGDRVYARSRQLHARIGYL